MRFAYIVAKEPFARVAEIVRDVALSGYEIEERDGLNVGGGQYFKIHRERESVILCLADYGDPPDPKFTHCLYVYADQSPRESRIEPIVAALQASGIVAEVEPSGDV